ncbi:MAG: ArsR family transcriptional regulator [Proteobacteria bacterium]|nr:ArsR family transcriptional regulator [Pseudomonadota bacterium]MBU1582774.1 ArsR family transcriptional regulator [Pseudomonadota bacterium]MBU2455941.1 ArsR family transcriptional regulator [Pseudomonadota bacterium]MBU2631913.1 ArsR family transcriptional regulator [Pseudomonadota bacterium]
MTIERIQSSEIRKKVMAGTALFVCAYDDDNKFEKYHLGGAISLREFKSKTSDLDKNQEIFFYCA